MKAREILKHGLVKRFSFDGLAELDQLETELYFSQEQVKLAYETIIEQKEDKTKLKAENKRFKDFLTSLLPDIQGLAVVDWRFNNCDRISETLKKIEEALKAC